MLGHQESVVGPDGLLMNQGQEDHSILTQFVTKSFLTEVNVRW